MLQQTQVATVLRYFDRWFELFPTIELLARAEEVEVLHAWQGLGYYSRARNLHACARWVTKHRGGKLPQKVEELLQLPGIGRYTAGAVASFAFNLPAPIIDGNVSRVLSRLISLEEPIDREPGKRTLWELAKRLANGPEPRVFNSAIMELGALVCTVGAPNCIICPVREFCCATNPEEIPRKSTRSTIVPRQENYRWVRRGDEILLRLCAGPRWKNLWILPPAENVLPNEIALFETRHSVTRFAIHLKVFLGSVPEIVTADYGFHRIADLQLLPMPTPHRRSINALLRGEPASAIALDSGREAS